MSFSLVFSRCVAALLLVSSASLFALGFQHYLAETYSNSTVTSEETLDDVILQAGVTYEYQHAYTFCIALACIYSIGFAAACVSLPLLSCSIQRTDRPRNSTATTSTATETANTNTNTNIEMAEVVDS